MKKKVKSKSPVDMLDLTCKVCGSVTPHFLNENGEYRCCICQHVDKKIKVVKIKKETPLKNSLKEIEKNTPTIEEQINNNIINNEGK